MSKIDCEVFKPKGSGTTVFVQALEELNVWRSKNPAVRVMNVETIMAASGGGLDGLDVRTTSVGLRVWFESE